MTHHKQVTVTVGEDSAEVDQRLAPLIESCWRLGIDTRRSCQSHFVTNKVWLGFVTAVDAEEFLNAVVSGQDPEWARAETWAFGNYEPTSMALDRRTGERDHPAGWEFYANVEDVSDAGEPPDFLVSIDVLFPTTDLARVVQALEEASG